VMQGTILYTAGDEAYELASGDTIFHKSNVPHQWQNIGKEEAVVLTVTTPSGF